MNKAAGKQKLIKDISANTLQTGITQVFGLVIFYMVSKYLSKDDFGEFNWSMAVGSTIIAMASLGLDLVFVKRIASGENVLVVSGIHFFHTVVVGIVLTALAFGLKVLVPAFANGHALFLFIFINLALSNIANSFKLCLNGLESYRQLAILSLCANIFKFSLILYLFFTMRFTILNVIFSYIATSMLEFVLGYYLMNKSIAARVKPILRMDEYKYFILESLPQLGVVLFDSALARIDWILLGIISTTVATADYSFTYKVFDLSKLPLLIVAPVLLTRFSKLFTEPEKIDDRNRNEIQFFFRLELFIVMFIPIVLMCCWTPLIDYFTDNKYGAVNEINYWILAPCVPLACIINFLWTLGFVQGQLRTIMFITIGISILNIIANALLIPVYAGMGASMAFLSCTLIQLGLYIKFIKRDHIALNNWHCLIAMINFLLAVAIAKFTTNNAIFTSVIAVGIHIALAFITRQISIKQLKQLIKKQV